MRTTAFAITHSIRLTLVKKARMIMFVNENVNEFVNAMHDKTQADILLALQDAPFTTQRALAEATGASLGKVNAALQALRKSGFLNETNVCTARCDVLFAACRPKRAVILAAGSGIRMAPLSELPKGLLMVQGVRLIDRLIAQLHSADVTDIIVITGFMKEKYEYLRDYPGVRLIYNAEYGKRNNLHSLALAAGLLENAYVLPSDIWFDDNPFSRRELYSWYLLSTTRCPEGEARINRRQVLSSANDGEDGFRAIGAAYLCGEAAACVASELLRRDRMRRYTHEFWECVLFTEPCTEVYARFTEDARVHEIDTFEELRALDYNADQLSSAALDVIEQALHVSHDGIKDVTIMKKGMTNRSFLFTAGGRRYIMRIPGEGSNVMINRRQEYAVYQTVGPTGLCDNVVYIAPDTGYKITEYWEGARVCDPFDAEDVRICMRVLRSFHGKHLTVPHVFDVFERIDYYESLLSGAPSFFADYAETKAAVLALRPYIEAHVDEYALTHIDAVPDNFLFIPGGVRLIDWEYASMQDPHIDIAMFAVYAMYDRQHVEQLIDSYFPEGCAPSVRAKLYCYIAVCGLLWSNWCEYKRALGVEFGEYALAQYRFAKEYCPAAREAIAKCKE